MKFFDSPRQPLLGLALSAVGGILLAEFFAAPLGLVCSFIVLAAAVVLIRPAIWLTQLLVAATFFVLHLVELTDAPGRALHTRLGERTRPVVVTGTVVSEPKISPNEFTTFLLRLDTIDLGTGSEPCAATVRARWKGNPQFGDEIRLKGITEPIPPARNPGGFDIRAYLARHDVFDGVFARYPGERHDPPDRRKQSPLAQRDPGAGMDAHDPDPRAGGFARCRRPDQWDGARSAPRDA